MFKFKKVLNYFKNNGMLNTFAKLYEYHLYKRFAQKYMAENTPSEEELEEQENITFKKKYKFSIVVPAYNPKRDFFEQMISSVLSQTYKNWELIIADGSDFKNKTGEETAVSYAAEDERIRYIRLGGNLGISANTNLAVSKCVGDYIAFLDHDDILLPHALFKAAEAIESTDADFLYSDQFAFEDDPSSPTNVLLKPDFGEYTLRGINFVGHLTIVKRERFNAVGGLRSEFDGSQDYDLALRLAENTKKICHIPYVLYGWRIHNGSTAAGIDAKQYCLENAKKAIAEHLNNIGINAVIKDADGAPSAYKTEYEENNALISIVVCFEGSERAYRRQMETIAAVTEEKNVEIISVGGYNCFNDVINLSYNGSYNFAQMANLGADEAQGKYLLFLEGGFMPREGCIEELANVCGNADAGAVGGVLCNKYGFVEEAGRYLTENGFECALKGIPSRGVGYLRFLKIIRNVQGMTGGFLMISRHNFYSAGCFNESLNAGQAGCDLCQILEETGKNNLINPYAKAVIM